MGAPDDYDAQVRWRNVRAMALARRGEIAAAEALGREAVAIAEKTAFLNPHADALMALAEVLRLAGKTDDAAGHVGAAIAVYERKENLVAARKAREALEALGVSSTTSYRD